MEIFIPFFILTIKMLWIVSFVASAVYYCKWYMCRSVPKSMAPIYEAKAWWFGCTFLACFILLVVIGEF